MSKNNDSRIVIYAQIVEVQTDTIANLREIIDMQDFIINNLASQINALRGINV